MADFTENFKDAPNGNVRQFGMLASTLGLGKKRNTGPKSISAKDQSALMAQQHSHNMALETHKAVVGHVLGQEASATSHKQTMAQNRQMHKLGEASAEASHTRGLEAAGQAHTFGMQSMAATQEHERKMANLHHENALNAVHELKDISNVTSYKSPSGASVQFSGINNS